MRFPAVPVTLLVLALAPAGRADPAAAGISITGAVEHPKHWSAAELGQLPATRETVFFHTGHGVLTGTFSGVLLWTLLQQAGIRTDPAVKNDTVRHGVMITGKDGYAALLSLGEIDPELGGAQAILAVARDGKPLDDKEGPARLIVPGDKAAAREVENVVTIDVK
jgi:DMSO/TMAO reductase YedYZ molybdopterin-dependent catalytic subunit